MKTSMLFALIAIVSLSFLTLKSGVADTGAVPSQVNTFNRLMTPKIPANLPPAEDGLHDPESPGTHELQHPKEAFQALEKSDFGNHVNWVKSLDGKHFTPRTNIEDPNVKPMVMNLNIVREVRGSMADVVFPHDKHTAILSCANCHPAVFTPQKGANQMSMASIMLGQSCGVCHGAVAFPVTQSTCTLCHAKPKDESQVLKRTQAGAK